MEAAKRNRIATNRGDARAALELVRAEDAKDAPEHDLDNETTQQQIMHPKHTEVELGGEKVRLYPVSGFTARTLVGLANQVFATAAGPGNAGLRIGGALVEMYLDRFLPILAESTFTNPDKVDGKQISKLITSFNKKTASPRGAFELANAFQTILEINGVNDFFVQMKDEKMKEDETAE